MQECKNHVVGVFRIASHADLRGIFEQSIKMSAENEKDYQFLVIKMSDETIAIIFGNIRLTGTFSFASMCVPSAKKCAPHSGRGKKLTAWCPR